MTSPHDLSGAPLGQTSEYLDRYAPELLHPMARAAGREALGLTASLPFHGHDRWSAFELSWLDSRGKPVAAVAEFVVPADSPNLIESKSLKLYLNSFNQTPFPATATVKETLTEDLSRASGAAVAVTLTELNQAPLDAPVRLPGTCLDALDITCEDYQPAPALLTATGPVVREQLFTDLFKSNCPVTGQPDWASVWIDYQGPAIDRAGLLRYLVSFRQHADFHEQCVERIFVDLQARCAPQRLSVYARYTRRGGLDINPFRSDCAEAPPAGRLLRQ